MNENNLWLQRWENQEIGFNQDTPNPFMVKYFDTLKLEKKSKILVPLCGKTIDIAWLLSQGYEVVGIELSPKAINELFGSLNLTPTITTLEALQVYRADNITIFVGDIFKVTPKMIGKIDAIYDRASLVALTKPIREKYTKHLLHLSNKAPQLLLCFEYDQSLMDRSPYSIDEEEVKKHYEKDYNLKMLCKEEIEGGFKGKLFAFDVVWVLA